MAMRRRTKPVNIPDAAALELLEVHVALTAAPKTLWQYSAPPNSKRPGCQWPWLKKMRPFLSDLLEATGGRVVKQKRFHRQVADFLKQHGKVWSLIDSEAAVYRLRMAMGAMLNHKKQVKKSRRVEDLAVF